MALYIGSKSKVEVTVPYAEKEESFITYLIKVVIKDIWWTVRHRYKDFLTLHELLISNHGLRKDLLPPKKILGNRDPEFIEKRRQELEVYLKNVVLFLGKALPSELCDFLEFDSYEIYSLLRKLAEDLYANGDEKLKSDKPVTFSPIQLHAIYQRLQLPRSPVEQVEKSQDFAHVLDFASRLDSLEIVGSRDFYLHSNVLVNGLTFDLSAFKSLRHLRFVSANVGSLRCARNVRETLHTLCVHSCGLNRISDILLCDTVHREFNPEDSQHVWPHLHFLDLSENCIDSMDSSLNLVPKLKVLNLSHNRISSVENLSKLSFLTELNLSNNRIGSVDSLHTKVGNIISLNLAQNSLRTLQGLGKLYGLVHLDVRCNLLNHLEAVQPITGLPCMETLILTGNPVTTVIDFRTKLLAMFGNRAAEVCLDNERTMQKELDTVAILQALSLAKIPKKVNQVNQ